MMAAAAMAAVAAPVAFRCDVGARLRILRAATASASLAQAIDAIPDVPTSALDALAVMLVQEEWTWELAGPLRPLLIDLVVRADARASRPHHDVDARWRLPSVFLLDEQVAIALAKLLPLHRHLLTAAMAFFARRPPFFERAVSLRSTLAAWDAPPHNSEPWRALSDAAATLLETFPELFVPLWRWTPMLWLLCHTDPGVKAHASRAAAVLLGWPSPRSFLVAVAPAAVDALLAQSRATLDALERCRLQLEAAPAAPAAGPAEVAPVGDDVPPALPDLTVTAADLSPGTVDAGGVLLYRAPASGPVPPSAAASPPLVQTPTTLANMRALAVALSIGSPVLLEGPTGAGKTALVEELARQTGRDDLIAVHLGDQTDGKALLGTYVSTDVAGEFRWQAGVLTRAVQRGAWILIEDLDLAPLDVVSVLLPLLETRHLFLPARGEHLPAAPGFQIFATRTTRRASASDGAGGNAASPAGGLLSGSLWTRVAVAPLSRSELAAVVAALHPGLAPIVVADGPALLDAFFDIVQPADHQRARGSGGSRAVSTRDLLRWCSRVAASIPASSSLPVPVANATSPTGSDTAVLTPQAVRQRILAEAIDVFAAPMADAADRRALVARMAERWELPAEVVDWLMAAVRPVLERSPAAVSVGRAVLPYASNAAAANAAAGARDGRSGGGSSPFAYTAHTLRHLERVAVAVQHREAVLLVGETGAGKTTLVQHLASTLGHRLVVINLSQQSEASDLLGGFKPVDVRLLASPLLDRFHTLFGQTFSRRANERFLDSVRRAADHQQWHRLAMLLRNAVKLADARLASSDGPPAGAPPPGPATPAPQRARFDDPATLAERWRAFAVAVEKFARQESQAASHFLFAFVEGALVRAVERGHWVLLDEINLATTEALEALSGLLDSPEGTLFLHDRPAETEADGRNSTGAATTAGYRVQRHPSFRLFACMNPATDVGKRDLPPALRNRFTELYIDEMGGADDLLQLVRTYLAGISVAAAAGVAGDVVDLYLAARRLSASGHLVDGAGARVHYSLRSLARSLDYAVLVAPVYGWRRALYEGLAMAFLTPLALASCAHLQPLLDGCLLAPNQSASSLLGSVPAAPADDGRWELVEGFWLPRGPADAGPAAATAAAAAALPSYTVTPSVRANLRSLARVVAVQRYPVLIQGATSTGKTSMVAYLAARTGHRCVRINNHEHTDLQEYLGTYVADDRGRLRFQEGVLVTALRRGYWLVLDELNLAPTDVLEALNRLLDDNRELRLPETQEVVQPHPAFMLFATQNPSGVYGGRKALSRAFRNRFLELHFDELPQQELATIIEQRAEIPPSYAAKIVAVFGDLQARRQTSRVFAGRHGYITLRDLFRWAGRHANGYAQLAEDGFKLLGERVRNADERAVVRAALETILKAPVGVDELYSERVFAASDLGRRVAAAAGTHPLAGIVWTPALRRACLLAAACLEHNEPVLLVGETGCGKTTVCQILAAVFQRGLRVVNCHEHTETADFLGGQRPVRHHHAAPSDADGRPAQSEGSGNDDVQAATTIGEAEADAPPPAAAAAAAAAALFAWQDGPLVQAMRSGELILLDEISLADDSVLERLNSVLEPERTLLLAERGSADVLEVVAHPGFAILATMNPGGDFGKKELSPALRNRFTEIWVPTASDRANLAIVVPARLPAALAPQLTPIMLDFVDWVRAAPHRVVSLRDVLAWVDFVGRTTTATVGGAPRALSHLSPSAALVHGAALVWLDALALPDRSAGLAELHRLLHASGMPDADRPDLLQALPLCVLADASNDLAAPPHRGGSGGVLASGAFAVPLGPNPPVLGERYALHAPTTADNAMRVLRALQLPKPILLEGPPGVGKTTLVQALAAAAGYHLVRINLSEQTDLSDLFGADLPVEGGRGGEFAWRDGPLLAALKAGHWILLDELNLASQAVLEGLNACLDHRATVYLPELDLSFVRPPAVHIFAAQNPAKQGGGRRGLPKSFLNRFSQVHVQPLSRTDLEVICTAIAPPSLPSDLRARMLDFNDAVARATAPGGPAGRRGAPWEFNLRDVARWIDLVYHSEFAIGTSAAPPSPVRVVRAAAHIYLARMRTAADRQVVWSLLRAAFTDGSGAAPELPAPPAVAVFEDRVVVGLAQLRRMPEGAAAVPDDGLHLLNQHAQATETIVEAVNRGWLTLVVGPAASGKTALVRGLAALAGRRLREFAMNSGVDTTELLGSFEQVDLARDRRRLHDQVGGLVDRLTTAWLRGQRPLDALVAVRSAWESVEPRLALDADRDRDTRDAGAAAAADGAGGAPAEPLDQLLRALAALAVEAGLVDPTWLDALAAAEREVARIRRWASASVSGRFEWVDGTLLHALEAGDWLLIDNVNFCSASVLDRLNPLFEPHGSLAVAEAGGASASPEVDDGIRIVRPHPDFRVFMTMDPAHGEISRAMRNRALEVALLPVPSPPAGSDRDGGNVWDLALPADAAREPVRASATLDAATKAGLSPLRYLTADAIDAARLVLASGLAEGPAAAALLAFHDQARVALPARAQAALDHRTLTSASRWLAELLSRGEPLAVAAASMLRTVYGPALGAAVDASVLWATATAAASRRTLYSDYSAVARWRRDPATATAALSRAVLDQLHRASDGSHGVPLARLVDAATADTPVASDALVGNEGLALDRLVGAARSNWLQERLANAGAVTAHFPFDIRRWPSPWPQLVPVDPNGLVGLLLRAADLLREHRVKVRRLQALAHGRSLWSEGARSTEGVLALLAPLAQAIDRAVDVHTLDLAAAAAAASSPASLDALVRWLDAAAALLHRRRHLQRHAATASVLDTDRATAHWRLLEDAWTDAAAAAATEASALSTIRTAVAEIFALGRQALRLEEDAAGWGALYRAGVRPAGFRTAAVYEAAATLDTMALQLLADPRTPPVAAVEQPAAWAASADDRRLVLEGLASLAYLDELLATLPTEAPARAQAVSLVAQIAAAAVALRSKLQSPPPSAAPLAMLDVAEDDLQTGPDANTRVPFATVLASAPEVRRALWPLLEAIALRRDDRSLQQLVCAAAVAVPERPAESLPATFWAALDDAVAAALAEPLVPVSSYVAAQRLLWLHRGRPATLPAAAAAQDGSDVLQLAHAGDASPLASLWVEWAAGWHRRLWTGALEDPLSVWRGVVAEQALALCSPPDRLALSAASAKLTQLRTLVGILVDGSPPPWTDEHAALAWTPEAWTPSAHAVVPSELAASWRAVWAHILVVARTHASHWAAAGAAPAAAVAERVLRTLAAGGTTGDDQSHRLRLGAELLDAWSHAGAWLVGRTASDLRTIVDAWTCAPSVDAAAAQRSLGLAYVHLGTLWLRCALLPGPADPATGVAVAAEAAHDAREERLAAWLVHVAAPSLTSGSWLEPAGAAPGDTRSRSLWSSVAAAATAAAAAARETVVRPDPPQISGVHAEMAQVAAAVLEGPRLRHLVVELTSGGAQARALESAVQATLEAAAARLHQRFPHYRDLVVPVLVGVYLVKYGLRLLGAAAAPAAAPAAPADAGHAAALRSVGWICRLPHHAPSVAWDLAGLADLTAPSTLAAVRGAIPDAAGRLDVLLALLEQVFLRALAAGWLRAPLRAAAVAVMDAIWAEWEAAEAAARAAAERAAETFRYRTQDHALPTEEEADEAAFRAAFPNFDAAFAHLPGIGPSTAATTADAAHAPSEAEASAAVATASRQQLRVARLHGALMRLAASGDRAGLAAGATVPVLRAEVAAAAGSATTSLRILQSVVGTFPRPAEWTAWGLLLQQSANLASTMVAEASHDRPEFGSSDATTKPRATSARRAHVRTALDDEDARLAGDGAGSTIVGAPAESAAAAATAPHLSVATPYSFYHSANIAEARRLLPVLEAVRMPLLALLAQWPGHDVLQAIEAITDRLLAFPVTVPLAQLVTGLELLLRRAQDWEQFAARAVSLRGPLEACARLVIRWRRLEVGTWSDLLAERARDHVGNTARYWFFLYDLSRAVTAPTDEDRVGDDRDDARSAGDRAGGTAGAPPVRLPSLLKPWLKSLDEFVLGASLGDLAARLEMLEAVAAQLWLQHPTAAHTVANLIRYYAQFAAPAAAALAELSEGVRTELRGFVKLAHWNDLNFYALKQSADKTHRTLGRVLRKFDAVLKQPFAAWLDRHLQQPHPLLDTAPASEPPTNIERSKQRSSGRKRDPPAATAAAQEPASAAGAASARVDAAAQVLVDRLFAVHAEATVGVSGPGSASHPPGPHNGGGGGGGGGGDHDDDDQGTDTNDLLARLPRLLPRLERLCAIDAPAATAVPIAAALEVDGAAAELIEQIVHFRQEAATLVAAGAPGAAARGAAPGTSNAPTAPGVAATVDRDAALKEAQARARALGQQQRRAWTMLLHELQAMGLSHRRAALHADHFEPAYVFAQRAVEAPQLLVPLEPKAMASDSGRVGAAAAALAAEVTQAWHSADRYHARALAKLAIARSALQRPKSDDLPRRDAERGAGYAEHLMHLCWQQRSILAALGDRLSSLRAPLALLESIADPDTAAVTLPFSAVPAALWDRAQGALDHVALDLAGVTEVLHAACSSGVTKPDAAWAAPLAPTAAAVHAHRQQLAEARARFDSAVSASDAFVPADYWEALASTPRTLAETMASMRLATAAGSTDLHAALPQALLRPLLELVQHEHDALSEALELAGRPPQPPRTTESAGARRASGACLAQVLLAIQTLHRQGEATPFGRTTEPASDVADPALPTADGGRIGGHLAVLHAEYIRLFSGAHLVDLHGALMRAATALSRHGDAGERLDLARTLRTAVRALLVAVQRHVHGFLQSHRATCKLALVLNHLVASLLTQGFCVPRLDGDAAGAGGDDGSGGAPTGSDNGGGDAAGAAPQPSGMGEGRGSKDVSDQIESEEQVLGTRNEAAEDHGEGLEQEEEQGLEMQGDFDGQLYDRPDANAGNEDEEDEDGSDQDQSVESQMGQTDRRRSEVLDKELWGDDDDDDADPSKDRDDGDDRAAPLPDVDQGGTGERLGESEMRAKADPPPGAEAAGQPKTDEADNKKKKKEEDKKTPTAPIQPESNDAADVDEGGNDDRMDEDAADDAAHEETDEAPRGLGEAQGGAGEEKDADVDASPAADEDKPGDGEPDPKHPETAGDRNGDGDDVPDDADAAGGDGEGDGDDESDDGTGAGAPREDVAPADDGTGDLQLPDDMDLDGNGEAAGDAPDPTDGAMDLNEDEDGGAGSNAKNGSDTGDDEASDGGRGLGALEPDLVTAEELDGDGAASAAAMDALAEAAAMPAPPAGESEERPASSGVQGAGGRASMSSMSAAPQPSSEATSSDAAPDATEPPPLGALQDNAAGEQRRRGPRRSDAAKNDPAAPTLTDEPSNPPHDAANPHRSLADALEQWRQRLELLSDRDRSASTTAGAGADDDTTGADGLYEHMDADDPDQGEGMATLDAATEDQLDDAKRRGLDAARIDPDAPVMDAADRQAAARAHGDALPLPPPPLSLAETLAALLGRTPGRPDEDPAGAGSAPGQGPGGPDDLASPSRTGVTRADAATLREQLEVTLAHWREAGEPDAATALAAFQQIELVTHDLAMELCEALRLILEPTLATKLRGDYRTGKRLNMRKIIPYVASQFRKDKIWLRRTRPAKRQYQVLIAVDDSRSMVDAGAARIAFETVAVLARALAQLDVGQVAVVGFGETVDLVHAFDQPFSADAGAEVLRRLRFRQERTYFGRLVEASVALLEDARERLAPASGGAGQPWQLQIIVSDGAILDEDRAAVARAVRLAAEKRVLMVCIAIDTREQPLADLKAVTYVDGQLRLVRYMDSFPFEYFLILRRIQDLPTVLGDALRQWFEVINNNSSG